MTFLNWVLAGALLVWALLLTLWFLGFGKPPLKTRLKRVGIGILCAFAIGFLAGKLLRYEGSASGSSFPRFSWVWDETERAEAGAIGEIVEGSAETIDETIRAAAGDLTQFLGPNRDGMWKKRPFGIDWENDPPRLLWKRTVGKAWSGFSVVGNQAVTQEQVGDAESILCLDLFSGKELWHHENPSTRLLLARVENGGAAMGGDGPRSTPTIHANRVYAVGGTGIVDCLDLETGTPIWSRNVVEDANSNIQKWGMANAPLILEPEHAVVVTAGDKAGTTLVAYHLDTGDILWRYDGSGGSYSSPRLLTIHGVRQIVSVNAKDVSGISPSDGRELWKHDWPGNFPKVGQPLLVDGDKVLATASYGVGSPFIQISKQGDTWATEELWKSTRMKTKFSSAVILDGFAYGLDEGRLACIDLETGSKQWKGEKYGFGQHLLFEDILLIQTERSGDVAIGRIAPDGFTELARIEALDGMTWNVPTVAGRILLVRNAGEAACFLLPDRK